METFGHWLLRHRRALGLIQKTVAERAGVSVSYISTLERDQPNTNNDKPIRPEPGVLLAIAKAVQGDPDEALAFFGYAQKRRLIIVPVLADLDETELTKVEEFAKFLISQR